MKPGVRRVATWAVLLGGLLGIAHQITGVLPSESRLVLELSRDAVVREVRIEVTGTDGQPWRNIALRPPIPNPLRLECWLKVPTGDYRIDATYELRPAGAIDKNHESDWTRMGVQHQIRVDGEDHHFPPPEYEAR